MDNKILRAGKYSLDLSKPRIMGILNVTPDSFSDGGRFNSVDAALRKVDSMLEDGADIIDIGAESTRPGANFVDKDTELSRLLPIIDAINKRFDCCLSIDTNKPSVMYDVLQRGVGMINDVRGFSTVGAMETVANSNAAICIMHMQGVPLSMQNNPQYCNIIEDVGKFLLRQKELATDAGISNDRIVIDPGFGFGKTPKQNMHLLKHTKKLTEISPVLFGLSKKSTLGFVIGDDCGDRTVASVVGSLLAIQNGASIVRVHDVKETSDAIKVYLSMLENK